MIEHKTLHCSRQQRIICSLVKFPNSFGLKLWLGMAFCKTALSVTPTIEQFTFKI